MPFDRSRATLVEILDNVNLAEEFVRNVSADELANDVMRFHATTRVLEIISEASRRLPVEMKARHPEVPWNQIAGAGNVYRHGYDVVAPEIVWNTAHDGLTTLRRAVEIELGRPAAT